MCIVLVLKKHHGFVCVGHSSTHYEKHFLILSFSIALIGKMAGDSPGYSLSLVAETTTGVLLSVERTANSRPGAGANPTATATGSTNWVATSGGNAAAAAASSGSTGFGGPELPEDVGREGAMMLLQEIYRGAIVCMFSLHFDELYLSLFRYNRWSCGQHAPTTGAAADGLDS